MIYTKPNKYGSCPLIVQIGDGELSVVADIEACENAPCLDVTDVGARYIEKLPEIVELLKRLAVQPGRLGTQSRIIINYAEGLHND